MGDLRRRVITGLIQLFAFLVLIAYAVVYVQTYYLRIVLFTAAFVDAISSVYFLAFTTTKQEEVKSE